MLYLHWKHELAVYGQTPVALFKEKMRHHHITSQNHAPTPPSTTTQHHGQSNTGTTQPPSHTPTTVVPQVSLAAYHQSHSQHRDEGIVEKNEKEDGDIVENNDKSKDGDIVDNNSEKKFVDHGEMDNIQEGSQGHDETILENASQEDGANKETYQSQSGTS